MKPEPAATRHSCAVLMDYVDGGWQSLMVCAPPVADIDAWVASIESRPRIKEHASGKPLAWLYLIASDPGNAQQLKAARSIGLLTDVLRALDRPVSAEELTALQGIFTRHGRPFSGTVE